MVREKWYFNGYSLCTDEWNVERVLEGLGVPGYRGSNIQVPFENGLRHIKKRYKSKQLILSMWVRGANMEIMDDNIDYLTKLFGMRGQHTLRRIMRSGEIREAQAEVYGPVSFVPKRPGYCKFSVEFELADPFFYGTDLTSQTKAIGSTEVAWTHSNPGTAPVTKAVITLNGPLDSPRLENLDNEIWLKYQGAIAAGETVVINTADFTCEKDGVNMISAIKHGGDAYWLTLEPGDNSMEVTTQETGGSIEIEYYPAYF